MAVTLEVLGCGDAFGSGGRFHSCYLLAAGDDLTLIDCGASAPTALQQRGIRQPDLGRIVLTHLHGDHFGGVPFLLLDAAFNRPRSTALEVAGPAGLEERMIEAMEVLFPGIADRVLERVPHRFVELESGRETQLGAVRVTPYPVSHGSSTPAYALRVGIEDRIVAFSGDTAWDPALLEASRNADLFVCECTAYREPVPSHISLSDLEAQAGALTAARMLLTHLGEEMLRHADAAPWPCATDGLVVGL